MILWVFIKNFGVKIGITDIYRYFTDIYRYFTDIYRYFFKKFCTSARAPQSRFFGGKIGFFRFFGGKIGFFRFFGEKSVILPIFLRFFFSVLAENRFFDEISAEKTDFLFPDCI